MLQCLNTSAPEYLCNLVNPIETRGLIKPTAVTNLHYKKICLTPKYNKHTFGEQIICLFLYFLLTFRVNGQQVADEGQRAVAAFITS